MAKPALHQHTQPDAHGISRRRFLKTAGVAAALGVSYAGIAADKSESVSLVVDPGDSIAGSPPAQWAAKELEASLTLRGFAVHRCERLAQAVAGGLCITVAGAGSPLARQLLKKAGTNIPAVAESLGLVPVPLAGTPGLLVCGHDARGLVYALLELADRVHHAAQPLASLRLQLPIVERPANVVRSLSRLWVSNIEDQPWYHDREMWPRYLTLLATQRFNRFNLSLGIGYDFLQNVRDGYFLFAYPFLLSVPGYNVRVPELPEAERERNLEMLKFISEQTVARSLQFQLGIWMHGYEWLNSPNPNYTIAGLSMENHGPYCRDAVLALLKACPAISGITFRIHGESGVPEGSYSFWKTVYEGVAKCGRKVEIDMHAKGMDQAMIDLALATGMPVKVTPKYWAEHLGMPYHQTEIRELERPKPGREGSGLMKLSSGARSFLRYGYGDLLKEDRRYGVLHRIWPGTQRLLLWGDPMTGAAYGKAFSFCGSAGGELMEPLSFKGRRGSGIAGDRCGYADAFLKPRWDWEKYLYSLRIWGRLLYNPEAEPDVWRRYLRKQFGTAAEATELALANASRILPIVTTAHGASAGNNTYWPEMYTNQSIIDPNRRHPYGDSPAPKVFGNVSPLDPQLFLRINDFVGELLKGERSGKYTPIEVAQWIEDYADVAAKHLAQAEAQAEGKNSPEFRRLAIDVSLQVGLGRFFGGKFRCGVLYAVFEQSGDRTALEEALKAYRRARAVWADLAQQARDVYQRDITVGELAHLRGHWLDRLPAMDEDIADMAKKLEQAKSSVAAQPDRVRLAIQEALGRPQRTRVVCRHVQPERFRAGQRLDIELSFDNMPRSARLYYRHVNQAERFETVEMQAQDNRYRATIPEAYTQSPYPLQYYFELKQGPETAWLYPGFAADLANQPYFVVRQILTKM
jgi:hypothetical protein